MENPETTNSRKRPSGDIGRYTKQASKRTYKSKKRKGPPNRYTKVKDERWSSEERSSSFRPENKEGTKKKNL